MKLELFVSGIIAAAMATSLEAAPHAYTFHDIGTLAGRSTFANDINANGDIVGSSLPDSTANYYHAFLYQNGTMVDLGTLGGRSSGAATIRDDGVILGSSHTSPTQESGGNVFLYENGVMVDLGFRSLGVSDLNANGSFVGWEHTSPGYSGYVYANGVKSFIPTLGGRDSYALGFNDAGTAVGKSHTADGDQHAIRFTNGVVEDLGTLGGNYSEARAINDAGVIAGVSSTSDSDILQLVVWQDGAMINLGTLGGDVSVGDINGSGVIVGAYDVSPSSFDTHAFIYQNGQLWDLNDLVDLPDGWLLTRASAINESGQIVGWASSNGEVRGFLLNPVPEPSAVAITSMGALALLRRDPSRQR